MDHREEIRHLSNRLADWDKSDGYTLPEGYFDSLQDKVLSNVEPDLSTYFDQLPDQVMNKITAEKKQTAVRGFTSMYRRIGIAAMVLICAGTMIYTSDERETNDGSIAQTVTAPEDDETLTYLLENAHAIDLDDLVLYDLLEDEVAINEEGEDLELISDEYLEELILDYNEDLLNDLL